MSGGLQLSVDPNQGQAPLGVMLTSHAPPVANPDGARYNEYIVDWRDGSAASSLFVGSGGDQMAWHVFQTPGAYNVHVYSSRWDNDRNIIGENDGTVTVAVAAPAVPLSAAARTRLVRFS